MQRTRIARYARPGPPLTRHPLGAPNPRFLLLTFLIGIVFSSHLRADKPLPPPAKVTVCSPDQAFCAIADPAGPSLSIFSRGQPAPIWSLPAWHRQFFLSNDGDHLVIAPDGLSLLPLDTKLSDPLLVFMNRKAVVWVVAVGELFPDLSSLRRTASHLEWGRLLGISPRDQLIAELVDGRRVAFSTVTGRMESEQ